MTRRMTGTTPFNFGADRRAGLRLVLLGLLSTATMCSDTSGARRVADRFVALYYDRAHVADAAALCIGDARARLEAELKFLEGIPAPNADEQSHATATLQAEKILSQTHTRYVYRVSLGTPNDVPLFAKLVMVKDGERWLVTKFEEKEQPS
jgi:hypothetical protein